MIQLATPNDCTACGACAFVCPKSCIQMQSNTIGFEYPVVDSIKCIECGRCQKVCPAITSPLGFTPKKAFAAWNNDEEERKTSASGGIAVEIYKWALKNGYEIVGAVQQSDFSVKLELSSQKDIIAKYKNSKYVRSTAYDVFQKIQESLKNGHKVVAICLPCQIAAFRNVFKDNENLLLVEIVCHGGTPTTYLQQHIKYIENKYNEKCDRMSFRDPEFETCKYHFSLYNSRGECFYSKRTADGDAYSFGFHRSVTYRDSCYNCHYARKDRIADVTLLDFKGVNEMSPEKFSNVNVSGVLVNTVRGENLFNDLNVIGAVSRIERPIDELYQTDSRLRETSTINKDALLFRKLISKNPNDFEGVMQQVMIINRRNNKIARYKSIPKEIIKKILKGLHCKKWVLRQNID